MSVRAGANGSFSFDGLEKTKYLLRIEDLRGKGEREIDLSRLGCFEATPSFYDGWQILGEPVILESPPSPELPEPPLILRPPVPPPRIVY
jgi:hypothetical protein